MQFCKGSSPQIKKSKLYIEKHVWQKVLGNLSDIVVFSPSPNEHWVSQFEKKQLNLLLLESGGGGQTCSSSYQTFSAHDNWNRSGEGILTAGLHQDSNQSCQYWFLFTIFLDQWCCEVVCRSTKPKGFKSRDPQIKVYHPLSCETRK